jgi:ABC-type sulfate/molybdate transport systems ATPase subunit/ABC-type sulfate transport system permease component
MKSQASRLLRDRRLHRWPLALAGALLVVYLLAPLAYLVPVAWSRELGATVRDQTARDAVETSFATASAAVAIMAVLGVPLGYVLARWRFPGRELLGIVLLVPLVFPPIVSGILLIALFGPYGFVGGWLAAHGLEVDNTSAGIVLAQIFVAAPFVIVSARAAFAASDATLDDVAATLGAGPLEIFWRIAVPRARAGILAGIALAWLRALGEYGATSIVAYHPYTLPVYVFVQLSASGVAASLPLALVALIASVAVVTLATLVQRQVRPAPTMNGRATEAKASSGASPRREAGFLGSNTHPAETLRADLTAKIGDFTLRARFEVPPGVTVVLGPSGAGKTLLLRCLASLMTPVSGGAYLGDEVLCAADGSQASRPAIGYVPQGFGLFDHLTVAANVSFGLRGLAASERRSRTDDVLASLRIAELAPRSARAISGGQAQRVALARALAPQPRLLLLDEPLSAIDPPLRAMLRRELRDLWRSWNIPIVLVTHDLADARALADRLLLLEDGKVVRRGTRDEVITHPGSVRAAMLLGARNLVPARVVACEIDALTLAIGPATVVIPGEERSLAAGDAVTVMLRPAALTISAEPRDGWHVAVLDHIEPGDGSDLAYVWLGDDLLAVALTQPLEVAPGSMISLAIPPSAVAETFAEGNPLA